MTEDMRSVQAITDKGKATVRVEDLRRYAAARHNLHKDHASSRPLSIDYELIGLVGEWQFAYEFGMPMDLTPRIGGDGACDFFTPAGSLDVKTARLAFNLLREVDKPHARYLVLAEYTPSPPAARLMGWEYDTQMLRHPMRTFGKHTIVNHYKLYKDLRKMDVLHWIFANARGVANA